MTKSAKDLTKQAATSLRHRTGGYAILSRMADKARADIAGTMGEYHSNCWRPVILRYDAEDASKLWCRH